MNGAINYAEGCQAVVRVQKRRAATRGELQLGEWWQAQIARLEREQPVVEIEPAVPFVPEPAHAATGTEGRQS